jgi:hypothetical protein
MKTVALFFTICICAALVWVETGSLNLAGATFIALLILAPEPKK